jgi:hypothetical protein
MLWQFVRHAPQLLPPHLIPHDNDAAAWLGLIQHYGGPTRFLDVTRSPYIALFFAFEAAGTSDRAVWAINYVWCMESCAKIVAERERQPFKEMLGRVTGAQAQLVYSLVHRQPYPDKLFASFVPFTGVFPVDPWKPDARQSAQQAMFLCAADVNVSFVSNLEAHPHTPFRVVHRFVLPGTLRDEVIARLAVLNVTAATLFPDLAGLARSLRTHTIRRDVLVDPPPWESRRDATAV